MIILFICLIITTLLGALIIKSARIVKEMIKNEKLNNLVNKFPENLEICKNILKKLRNENVIIEQTEESKTSLYVAVSNKIIIANIRENFTRVQTIAHECLHSVQNRKMLLVNFIFSNLYLIYFVLICILTVLGITKNGMLNVAILTITSFIYYAIRSYLETDAMTKAGFVAKEYIEENNLCSKEELHELINKYDKLNKIGIPLYNYGLLFNVFVKILIYCIIVNICC